MQAQPVPPSLVSRMLGNRVAVSPIVTIEPRRRKFHRPITLTMPLPRAAQKGMLNQYGSATSGGGGGDAPTLRLLCSIMGKSQSEPLKLLMRIMLSNALFTTTIRLRFDRRLTHIRLQFDCVTTSRRPTLRLYCVIAIRLLLCPRP